MTTTIGASADVGRAVAVQPDGKIVVAGIQAGRRNDDFALARYNPDGTLDTTLRRRRQADTDFGRPPTLADAVAIQADGKIVAAGWLVPTHGDFALARYNPTARSTELLRRRRQADDRLRRGDDVAHGVAIQPDGKIVVGRPTAAPDSQHDFALARYNADGSLDTALRRRRQG